MRSVAERLQQVMELLGGQPQRDDDGNILLGPDGKVLLTPSFISKEEALKLLDLESDSESNNGKKD